VAGTLIRQSEMVRRCELSLTTTVTLSSSIQIMDLRSKAYRSPIIKETNTYSKASFYNNVLREVKASPSATILGRNHPAVDEY
jgi:hypothetical protein